MNVWAFNWRKNGWRNANGKQVVNKELIDYILTLLETRQRSGQPVQIEYVKGHSGDQGNDGADALAVAGCECPGLPERDWVRLKKNYEQEQDMMADLVGVDPDVSLNSNPDQTSGHLTNNTQDFILSEEELMRELKESG